MNDSDRYNGALRLRRALGMRGYGVYSRLVELIVSAPKKRVVYDLGDFAFDMNEDENFIRRVCEEFDLFEIKDGWIEDPYTKTPEALEEERRAQIRRNRSEGAKKAAATRRAQKEALEEAARRGSVAAEEDDERPEVVASPTVELRPIPRPERSEENETGERAPEAVAFDRIVALWNERFNGTRQRYDDLTPSSFVWETFRRAREQFTDQDFKDAFDEARRDKWAWLFKDVLKPSNMQMLLAKKDRRERAVEDEYDFETKEMVEYGESQGWNWRGKEGAGWLEK